MSGPYTPVLTNSMSAMTSSGRPMSAASRNRIDVNGNTTGAKVYGNNLYAGDVLAGEEAACVVNAGAQQMQPKPPPASLKVTQQRAFSAQRRMDRLQMGGLAQSTTDSRPGTANTGLGSTLGASSSGTWSGTGSPSSSAPGTPVGSMGAAGPFQPSRTTSRLTGLAQPTAAAAGGGGAGGYLGGGPLAGPAPTFMGPPAGAAAGAAGVGGHRIEAVWASDVPATSAGSAAGRALMVRGLAASYDPTEEANSISSSSTTMAAPSTSTVQRSSQGVSSGPAKSVKPDFSNMMAFLTSPGPQTGHVLCYIQRDKSLKGHSYQLFYEGSHTFLLSAQQAKKATGASYAISSTTNPAAAGSKELMGKIRSNFIGTEFTISDGGRKQDKKEPTMVGENGLRKDLGAIMYQHNVLGTRGPRKMTAAVPHPDRRRHSSGSGPTCLERLQTGTALHELLVLKNKAPKWNDALGAYCLNFNKRVTEASVKNFQLVVDGEDEQVVLQFGKVGDTVFTCDFMWPLTPLQAFAICLSSFDNKLACE